MLGLTGPMPIPSRWWNDRFEDIGTRVCFRRPPRSPRLCVPDITACAAKWTACCDEPHCRSIVTAGTLAGSFAASTALRAKANACSPALGDAAEDHVVHPRRIDSRCDQSAR